ncbi:MAG: hypothetical protein ORN23_08280 [Chthoniobacterales bacterium]|nr:hypothetical protein [Chthoniobacterales bacterium]
MARWFISRSPDGMVNEGELAAYRALQYLDDSWSVCWCYDYLDDNIPREGDFLILGPDGRLLVLEVKTRARVFAPTGQNDGDPQKRAEDQVQAQKAGVLKAMQDRLDQGNGDFEMPWTVAAIFSAKDNRYYPKSPGQPFTLIGGPEHLRKLPQYWQEITSGGYPAKDPESVRNLFNAVYGDGSAEAEAKFISETDRLLHDKASADFSLLEALSENSQLLVRGGPGSGKTWMAERHAGMLASQGMDVLFLCYNKALGASLTQSFHRLRITGNESTPGKITVRTWEELSEELIGRFAKEELPAKPPSAAPQEELQHYYDELLPSALLAAVTAEGFQAPFDALVVDEAQDHRNDWWEIYFALLTGKVNSQMGLYYDPAQRPAFLSGEFNIAKVSEELSGKAHLQLLETRRYTRPVFKYLQSLENLETERLIEGLRSSHLLAGPEVILRQAPNPEMAKSEAAALLKDWFDQKLVSPEETLLLFPKDPFSEKHRLFENDGFFANCRIVSAVSPDAGKKGFLRATSFNKSKGLDARAVVLIGTPRWEDLESDQRLSYWIAASRARQMLAVVSC